LVSDEIYRLGYRSGHSNTQCHDGVGLLA
jgi:hypothetical protein